MYIENIRKSNLFFIALLVGILNFLINLSKTIVGLEKHRIFINFVFLEFGNLADNMLLTVRWILLQIVCIFLFCDYISKDFNDNNCLIFTRVNNRKKYFTKQAYKLLLNISIFFTLSIVPMIIMEKNFNIGLIEIVISILFILYIYLIILLINILNIFIKSNFSIIFVLFFQLISIMFLNFTVKLNLKTHFFKLNPFTSVFFINLNNNTLNIENLFISIFTTICTLVFILIISRICINNIDLIKEEY